MKTIFIVKKSFKDRYEQKQEAETNFAKQKEIDRHTEQCENTINEITKNGTPEKIDFLTDKEIDTIKEFAKQVFDGKPLKQAQKDTQISIDLIKRSNILQFIKNKLKQ